MKDFLTQEMSDSEIKTGLKLLKKLLTKHGEYYEINHAHPLNENCYISSCGVIIGVYFPNSEIKVKNHSFYNLITISKVNNNLGVVYSLRDDAQISDKARIYFNDYLFYTFDELLYTREENEIKKAIEKRIKDYNKNIETLNKIKRVYKKDGKPFARLLDNFTGVNMRLDYSYINPVVNSIKINYDEIYIYRKDEDKNANAEPTIDEMSRLLSEAKERFIKYLEQEKNNLKQLEKTFSKYEKITKALKDFFNETPNKYDYKKQLEYMIL